MNDYNYRETWATCPDVWNICPRCACEALCSDKPRSACEDYIEDLRQETEKEGGMIAKDGTVVISETLWEGSRRFEVGEMYKLLSVETSPVRKSSGSEELERREYVFVKVGAPPNWQPAEEDKPQEEVRAKTWKERLVDERVELGARILRLTGFLNSRHCDDVKLRSDVDLLWRQYNVMTSYRDVLDDRIAKFMDVKAEKKKELVPWTSETCPREGWTRWKSDPKMTYRIDAVSENGANNVTYAQLLKDKEYSLTGTGGWVPCGTWGEL